MARPWERELFREHDRFVIALAPELLKNVLEKAPFGIERCPGIEVRIGGTMLVPPFFVAAFHPRAQLIGIGGVNKLKVGKAGEGL
jgi:hypothetical protein